MRKFILKVNVCFAFLLIMGCSGKDSKVFVKIPDTNFNAYLLENFDQNKDGNISLKEAKTVKELICSGKNIKQLNGIEKFTNLEKLDCRNNELEELELRFNKKLNRLLCTNNSNPLTIYIGMSSPLKLKSIQKPKSNEQPQVTNVVNPLDPTKCTFDKDKTIVYLSFDD